MFLSKNNKQHCIDNQNGQPGDKQEQYPASVVNRHREQTVLNIKSLDIEPSGVECAQKDSVQQFFDSVQVLEDGLDDRRYFHRAQKHSNDFQKQVFPHRNDEDPDFFSVLV